MVLWFCFFCFFVPAAQFRQIHRHRNWHNPSPPPQAYLHLLHRPPTHTPAEWNKNNNIKLFFRHRFRPKIELHSGALGGWLTVCPGWLAGPPLWRSTWRQPLCRLRRWRPWRMHGLWSKLCFSCFCCAVVAGVAVVPFVVVSLFHGIWMSFSRSESVSQYDYDIDFVLYLWTDKKFSM